MKVFMALRLYFCIFLGALLVITTVVLAQQPQSMTESPETMELDSKITKSMQDQRWDLERFIEMTNPKEAADLLRKHAEKYGIPLDSTPPSVEVDAERESSRQMERNKNQHLIHLFNGLEFIPMSGVEVSLSEKITSLHKESGSDEKLVCIIQFQGKMTIGDIIELLESDVKIYEDIARRTYLARLPASLVSALSSKSYIRWIGEYKPEYKYEAILSDSKRPEAIIYPMGGDRQEYREDLQRLGVIIKHYDTKVNLYEVLLDNSQFKQVAEELWWVKGISKIPDDMLHQVNESFEPDDSRELVNAFKTSFTGNGVPIGVRDTGIWHGNTLDFPDGSYDDYGNHGDIGGHGTHVCGIIAARGGRNIEGVYDAKGVAPDATLYVISGVAGIGGDYSYGDAFLYFFAHDILISNHSWGLTSAPGVWLYDYNDDTENIDGWADSDMAIIFSAGNNEDPRTIGNPGTAKNVITVGAINYVEDDYRIPDIGDRAGYSSQGPTADDSRLKPDLVAPGGQRLFCRHGVISTNNSNASDGCTWPSSSWYIGKYGTSMAAPHVTGVCAKIQEWKPDIHSELLKALLINTTIPIKENSDDNLSGYATTAVGYGLVNGFSVTNYYRGESNRLLFGQGVVSEDDPEQDWSISVSPQAMKLIATLAYNDLKGKESDTDVLKDNLDLALISPGGAYYWAHDYLDAADGVTDESPLEKMVITNPESGTWTVKVRFTDGPLFDDPLLRANEVYGVVAHEILKTPSLSLTIPEDQKIIEVWPEEYFALNPRVTNDGGYIATGVTLRIGGGRDFKEDINQTKYVGNLIYQGDNASHQFIIQAPTVPGVYTLTAQADGINKDFDNPDYPRMEQITVKVMKSLTVNTSDDLDDGTCDDSHCSLREALNASNNDPILYQINFNIPGSGPHSIELLSPLPIITDQIIIDATTQPGYDGEPLIELISPWSNVIDGLVITAGNSIVRGLEINAAGDGIRLQDNGNNLIERNVIHCWYDGISIENSSNNLIGGHLGETGNIIYNNAEGIRITGSGASGNRIVGNIVGTDGYVYYCGNNHNGIYLTNASENTIGGNDAYEANIISGNGENGVYIDGIQSTGNEILGNYIGTDIPGSLNIGNLRNGILIESSSGNFIGPGNIIAYNDEDGVAISSWTIGGNIINPILSNKIYSNEELGIDLIWLDPEVTINDFHDLDAGPNGLQNYPLITSAASDGLGINIYGIMHSNPSTPIRIQFFSNSAYDPSGYGEGERFLGETELTTDANGDARFTKRILGRLFANPYVTATATGPYGTSEFSPYFTAASVLIKEVKKITVFPGDTGFSNASIPQSMAWAGFNSFWSGSTVVMTLTTPSGIEIDKNAAGVFYEHGSTYETYKIPNPEPGQWIIKLFGEDVPQSGEDVMVVVSGEPTDPTLAVNVDIKPGEEPNSVNCTNANGLITVAILTTPDFDALSVDHTKVSFGLTGIEASEHHVKKNGDMVRHEKDVDRDGDKDLVFHFRYGNTSLDCDSKQAVLIGETNDGLQVMGIDEIRMVGSLAKGEDLAGEVSSPEIPDKFSLGAAYPNPFNPVTHISYGLPVPANIKIDIYDILGRKIKTLINEQKEAGFHTITIDGSALSSGIYLYRLEAVPMTPGAENIFVKTQKMVLTK